MLCMCLHSQIDITVKGDLLYLQFLAYLLQNDSELVPPTQIEAADQILAECRMAIDHHSH